MLESALGEGTLRAITDREGYASEAQVELGSGPVSSFEVLTEYRVEDDLKRNLAAQKVENVKLQNNIAALQAEKTQLQQYLVGLERRIAENELAIGQQNPNLANDY